MESADYCRQRAAHYRRLAAEDGTLRQHFEELAQQYDKLADAVEQEERNQRKEVDPARR